MKETKKNKDEALKPKKVKEPKVKKPKVKKEKAQTAKKDKNVKGGVGLKINAMIIGIVVVFFSVACIRNTTVKSV